VRGGRGGGDRVGAGVGQGGGAVLGNPDPGPGKNGSYCDCGGDSAYPHDVRPSLAAVYFLLLMS
jgi:hypothetical protein